MWHILSYLILDAFCILFGEIHLMIEIAALGEAMCYFEMVIYKELCTVKAVYIFNWKIFHFKNCYFVCKQEN